jgi:steroid delta-isomerase-like uncharacterized protein
MMAQRDRQVLFALRPLIRWAEEQARPAMDRNALDSNKSLVSRFIESVNGRDYTAFDSLLSEDFSIPPGEANGMSRETIKSVIQYYVSAFPDLHYVVEDLVAEGDTVVALLRMSGTNRGDYQGHAGTGKTFAVDEVDVFAVREGQIAGYRITWDEAGFARQLGFS